MLRRAVSRLAEAPAVSPAASRSASTLTQILDGSVWCVPARARPPAGAPLRAPHLRGGGHLEGEPHVGLRGERQDRSENTLEEVAAEFQENNEQFR